MFKHNIYYPGLLFFIVFLLSGCNSDTRRAAPDVSHIEVDLRLLRFDHDLSALDTADLERGMQQMAQKYPALFPLFTVRIIHDQTNPKETPAQALKGFLTAPQIRYLLDTVRQVYGDPGKLEAELAQMLRYYKYYFPQKPVPQVAAIVSEFAVDAFTLGDSLCGIGLDLFLGPDFPGYNPEIFPDYIRRQFQSDYIPVRLAKALAQNIAGEPSGNRLLDFMLANGKILYITDCLLPETPDSLKMGYTRDQIEGCEANEQLVWARLLEEKLLYSADLNVWKKLVTPSPNAPVVFQEAPGEVGNWIGWQIVKAYMRRHPETTLKALLEMKDAQKFLEQAKYKPKR
jgi:hypothetical protein